MGSLYINDEFCKNLDQLKTYFNDCLSDNDVYTDLLESARNGWMSQFLLALGEDKLANRIETIDCKLCDHDYMSQLSLIIIGEPTSIEKVAYYDCFTITNVKCVDIGKKILVSIYIKILSHINEEYNIKIKSNFGENKFVFNPTLFEEGRTITREQEIDKVSYEPFVGTLEVDNNPLTISIECNSNRIIHVKDDVYISMVHVKGGSFWMGRGGDSNHNDALVHHVSLSDFYIAETQVTQKLWEAVMDNNPSLMKGEEFPVESVNWIECQNFLTELNNLTRLQFRLPTEAEWEFAARGGRKSEGYKYAGSDSISECAWYDDNKTHPVKQLRANELGIYDMSGNISEWCYDQYQFHFYTRSSYRDPICKVNDFNDSSLEHVCRGGDFMSCIDQCTVWKREHARADFKSSHIGLRLAL